MIAKLWSIFTSLRLTVICLGFGIILVFLGTIAQVNEGLWEAQERWFRSFFIWTGPAGAGWKIPVMPGGYLLGFTLVLNLIAAHIKRFQFTKKKVGINLTHFGIILLLVGLLATDLFSDESLVSFREGESRAFTESHRENELVFIRTTGNDQDEVVSIPEEMAAAKSEINHEKLPFSVRVKDYHENSEVLSHDAIMKAFGQLSAAVATVESQYASADGLVPQAEQARESEGRVTVWREALAAVGENDARDIVAAAARIAAQPERAARLQEELKKRFQGEMMTRFTAQGGAMRYAAERIAKKETISAEALPAAASNGAGKRALIVPLAVTREMDKRNLPAATVELEQGGKSLGTWLVSPWLNDEELEIADGHWHTSLRWARTYLPYSMKLLKTTHEVYRGTEIPKNFQSRVSIDNPQTGERGREVDIYMNNPLRYEGLTFYQYQMGKDERSAVGNSTLQVVKNPSWLTPYFGCAIVALGMMWQFMYHLVGFMTKRRTA
ncbi:MAG: cytochrome c biogenesis protein ResB [Chthoniobacteraceae bacterium]